MAARGRDGAGPQRRAWRAGASGAAGAALVLLAGLRAVDPPGPELPPPPPAETPALLPAGVMPAGRLELARLVDLAAAHLGVPIAYDPTVVKGQVTVRASAPLAPAELWLLLDRSLAANGLTTVRTAPGNSQLTVVRLADAAQLARLEPGGAPGADPPPPVPEAGFIAVLAPVRAGSVRRASEAVRLVLSRSGTVTGADEETGLLLVADLSARVHEALRVLADLDRRATEVRAQRVRPRHTSAARLAARVTDLAGRRRSVSGEPLRGTISADGDAALLLAPWSETEVWEALIEAADQPAERARRSYRAGAASASSLRMRVAQLLSGHADGPPSCTDAGADGLEVLATEEQHALLAAGLVDERRAAEPDPVASGVFPVRHRAVREVAEVLARLAGLEPAVDGGPADAMPGGVGGGPMSQPGAPAGGSDGIATGAGGPQAAQLAIDEGTSTIFAVAPASVLERLAEAVRRLDVRQPQVMVEVVLLSLTEQDALDLGVELERVEILGDARARLASLFGLSVGAEEGRRVPDGPGFTGVVLSPGEFTVVVRALQTLSRGRQLSHPRVLVTNNEQATLTAVLQQPFASTNASQTVATTSFGGTQDAGTTVLVRPQLAAGDHLRLEYQVSLSAFVGASADPALPPPRQQNNVRSVATIPDGFTVAVGGLDLVSENAGTSQVPLLGDVPVLGELVKSRSRSSSRSRFYIFIRARILRNERFADLREASGAAAADAGIPTDAPVTPARVIP